MGKARVKKSVLGADVREERVGEPLMWEGSEFHRVEEPVLVERERGSGGTGVWFWWNGGAVLVERFSWFSPAL